MATSNIRIKKKCEWCGSEFEAQKYSTRFCSKRCAEHAYKDRKRQELKKETESQNQASVWKSRINEIGNREYLSIADASKLLNVTTRAIYNLIYRGVLNAYRITGQWTVIKRADIEAMIEARPYERKPRANAAVNDENGEPISEFYTTKEIMEKFGVSNSWIFAMAKKHNIPKVYHRGKTLWSKVHCNRVFRAKPQEPDKEEWISYSQVREEYNLTHDQLHHYAKYHGLKRKKIGKYTYLLRQEIDAILRPPTM